MRIDLAQFALPCDCGHEHKIDVQEIVIESGAVKRLEEIMNTGYLKKYQFPVILCDTNTYQAAAGPMKVIFDRCCVISLPAPNLHANNYGVDMAHQRMPEKVDLLLAVGSGTIHDLCRFLAFEKGIPFVSVPTAASVDGFVSTVAAMTWNGMKKTMPAAAPICVIADTDIFLKAPYRLTASGISDLFGKYIALADWQIAHLVTGEYLCERVYKLELKALDEVKECLEGLRLGEREAYEKLMYALLLSGLAMQMIGNSRPASGAEHHVSHLWEMEIINDFVDAYHGEKVSIGLMLCAKKYEKIAGAVKAGLCRVCDYKGMEMNLLEETFGKKNLLEAVLMENTPDPMACVRSETLEQTLPVIAEIIEKMPSAVEIESLLIKGGCVKSVEDVGLDESIVSLTMRLSPYVRNRLSFNRMSKMLIISEN